MKRGCGDIGTGWNGSTAMCCIWPLYTFFLLTIAFHFPKGSQTQLLRGITNLDAKYTKFSPFRIPKSHPDPILYRHYSLLVLGRYMFQFPRFVLKTWILFEPLCWRRISCLVPIKVDFEDRVKEGKREEGEREGDHSAMLEFLPMIYHYPLFHVQRSPRDLTPWYLALVLGPDSLCREAWSWLDYSWGEVQVNNSCNVEEENAR
jgi:hypothetical protein